MTEVHVTRDELVAENAVLCARVGRLEAEVATLSERLTVLEQRTTPSSVPRQVEETIIPVGDCDWTANSRG